MGPYDFRYGRFFPCIWFIWCLFASSLGYQSAPRELSTLSPEDISLLASSRDPITNLDPSDPNSHLSKILIPRAPETDNNTLVRSYIVSTLKALDWHIEEDSFAADTPYGSKRFTNVIATKDPEAPRKFTLSAHFDSKFFESFPDNQFVGATDSAAPCAIMLDVAEALDPLLNRRKERLEAGEEEDEDAAETTLQLIFFDGEEAFKDWTDADSIYGAKHLAEKWAATYVPLHTKRRLTKDIPVLATIEHLVLLDLLGAPNPLIRSYFLSTAWLFDALVSAERRLAENGPYGNSLQWTSNDLSFFIPRNPRDSNLGYIGDDHVPFLQRGVSVLHVIPGRFPSVWHTLQDDASALDLPTMGRWNLIFRLFTAEYLGLRPEASETIRSGRTNGDL